VLVYYEAGNSQRNGFDIYKEIRWMGKDRIYEFHLKDNPKLLDDSPLRPTDPRVGRQRQRSLKPLSALRSNGLSGSTRHGRISQRSSRN